MSALSFPFTTLPRTTGAVAEVPPLADTDRKPLTKKEISADHPTWCPGCGDFSVLALYFKLIERRKLWHEKVTTVAGIGLLLPVSPISSRPTALTSFTDGRCPSPVVFR